MKKANATQAVIDHSDPTSEKHAKDKQAQDINKLKRLSTGLMQSLGKEADSNPLVLSGVVGKELDYDHAGFLVSEGKIASPKVITEAVKRTRNEIDALGKNKIRTGSLENHKPARDRRKESKTKKISGEQCISKHTFTVDPVVSGYFSGLPPFGQQEFLELLFPKILDYMEQQFPETKKLGVNIHADTAHLHFDIWMQKGTQLDFGGRIGKGFLYQPHSDATRGIGTGICHLARKERLYQLAREPLLLADHKKLESGRELIKKTGRDLDLQAQNQFDQEVLSLIPKESYLELAQQYASEDKNNSPFKVIDNIQSLHTQLTEKQKALGQKQQELIEKEQKISAREAQCTAKINQINQTVKSINNKQKQLSNSQKDLNRETKLLKEKSEEIENREVEYNSKLKEVEERESEIEKQQGEAGFWKLWGQFALKKVFKKLNNLSNLVTKTTELFGKKISPSEKEKIKEFAAQYSEQKMDQTKPNEGPKDDPEI